ncbi:MAG: hypothetical protein R2748_13630 [Bryobacterales bacterium]
MGDGELVEEAAQCSAVMPSVWAALGGRFFEKGFEGVAFLCSAASGRLAGLGGGG